MLSSQLLILYLVIRPALEKFARKQERTPRGQLEKIALAGARRDLFEILMTRGPLCNYREANGHAKRTGKREKKKKKKKKNKKKRKN